MSTSTSLPLNITVLGAGSIGGTLGAALARAGHKVTFGARNPDKTRQELKDAAVSVAPIAESLGGADVVLLAVPAAGLTDLLQTHGAALEGKLLIDATNTFENGMMRNNLSTVRSLAPGARVIRAFNSLGWENFAHPTFGATQADLFFCAADDSARQLGERLIADVGLRPIYLGNLEQAGLLDGVGSLWAALAFGQQRGRHIAFKLLED